MGARGEFEFTKDFRGSRPRAAQLEVDLPPWGNRRAPMPTERERFTFLSEHVPLLARVDERVRWSLAYEGSNETWAPREVLIEEGDAGRDLRFYVVRGGEALVVTAEPLEGAWVDDEGMQRGPDDERVAIDPVTGKRVLATLRRGDFFGESALLTSQRRSATVRAGYEGLEVVAFDAQSFHGRIAEAVLVFRMVRAEYAGGGAPDVRRLGLFNDLPMHHLSTVLHDARQESFGRGEAIVEQGDAGDRFYVVLDGEVLVERDGTPVARLARGDFFGEVALLLDVPRTATVRATLPTSVWSITGATFELVVRNYLLGREHHAQTVRERIGPTAVAGGGSLAARLRRGA